MPDQVDPGPVGEVLLTLAGDGPAWTPWAPWGRPQPGMFVGRLAGLLTSEAGSEATVVRALRDRAASWAARGVTFAEVVGRDPGNRNVALRPAVTPARLDPWGGRQEWLHGVWVVVDATAQRVRVESDRWPGAVLPVYGSLAIIGGHDPASLLLRTLSMGHGWEWVAMGFPALPVERDEWGHLPRLTLADGTVLSARRWTVAGEAVERIRRLDGLARYLAWRALVDDLGLPARFLVRSEVNPNTPPFLVCADSPLAVDALLDDIGDQVERLVVTEPPADPEHWPVVDERGGHHAAELAVTWWNERWPETAWSRRGEARHAVAG